MRTSNIILLATSVTLTLYLAAQILSGLGQIERTRKEMRPIMEQLDKTEIKVIRMERDNDNYVADNHRDNNYIYFLHYRITPEMLRIEGDTLVVATDRRVVVHIPSATNVIEWDGTVRALKTKEE